ncbi:MAG: dihydrolipoyl dehydrogenase [Clostridiales bacterium]
MTSMIVIGGGPGGYVAAIRAAQLGAEVTLIEKEHLGGTCLNIGCIPMKALLHSAELLTEAKYGALSGVIAAPRLDFDQMQKNKSQITAKLVRGVTQLLKANGVEVISGQARFTGPKTLEITDTSGKHSLSADKIIIATGSLPAMPPIPGLDSGKCIDSTQGLNLSRPPASMVIIGGGVIGIEMATAYSSFGTNVTVIEMLPEVLPMIDKEIAEAARKQLEKDGVKILTGAKVMSVTDSGALARVQIEIEGRKTIAEGEKVLVCTGRRPNTASLGLEEVGVLLERGFIAVSRRMETNIPGVYAIGDCASKTMLAHVASVQGEIAAENAMGHEALYDESTNPSCVYTVPEIATVGLTEEACKAKDIAYSVGKFPLVANGKSLIMNGGVGMIKVVVAAEDHKILGVHMVGPRATDLITEGALAIGLGARVKDLINTIHGHPTVGEAVREAALAVEKRAIHMVNR